MFDALKYTKRLERCGFTKEQAEEALSIGIEVMNENLATKHDMQELKKDLSWDIQDFKQEVKSDIQSFKQEVRSDIQNLKQEVKQDINGLRQEVKSLESKFDLYATKQDLAALQDRLTIRMGAMFAATIAILGSLKFL